MFLKKLSKKEIQDLKKTIEKNFPILKSKIQILGGSKVEKNYGNFLALDLVLKNYGDFGMKIGFGNEQNWKDCLTYFQYEIPLLWNFKNNDWNYKYIDATIYK